MKLTVNNRTIETTAETVSALANELALPAAGVAVAVNNRMVPRTEWETYALTEGMQVVIIKAACGG
ncbi:MAG: sulfur carrier protein ThiS [Bacteroides sp.]|nr:sulfur carrier protein ThiS [Bacteroides sp.]